MGMTLWIHVLEGRKYSEDSNDYTLMYNHADTLDSICAEMGVRKLSEYFDFTDLHYNDAEEEGIDEEAVLDPETGLGYGIDDMVWFEAAEGKATLQTLRDRVARHSISQLSVSQCKHLIEELDDCISILEVPATRAAAFHLAVIE